MFNKNFLKLGSYIICNCWLENEETENLTFMNSDIAIIIQKLSKLRKVYVDNSKRRSQFINIDKFLTNHA